MTTSRGVGIVAALALVALGAAAFTVFGTRYGDSEAGLEGYLIALQQKQLEYFTKHREYATTLEELHSIGLARVPDSFIIISLESSSAAFCWAGQVLGDPSAFTVSSKGVKRSSGNGSNGSVSSCQ